LLADPYLSVEQQREGKMAFSPKKQITASDSPEILSEEAEFMREKLEKAKKFHTETDDRLTLISHRGMGPTSLLGHNFPKEFLPENTIPAFKQAMLLGTDGIELDIFKSKDGKLMVVHDDELWRNEYGMPRDASALPNGETKSTYKVGEKNSVELKKLSMGPSGEKMPELREVFELAREANKIRLSAGLKPIILNVELKDSTATTECLDLIQEYMKEYPDSGVNFDSICFCSFNHDCLIELKKEATKRGIESIQIAPGIKTSVIYGEENVDKKTFAVKDGATHSKEGLKSLQETVEGNNFTAYDGILWDMGDGLINLAASGNKQIHASTSDFREYEADIEFATYLYKMSRIIPTYFKCDEIEKAMEVLSDIAQEFRELDEDRLILSQKNDLKSRADNVSKSLSTKTEDKLKSTAAPISPLGYLAYKKPAAPYSKVYKETQTGNKTPSPEDPKKPKLT
jgi:glycerophosphoryl diester phosphodiesterase